MENEDGCRGWARPRAHARGWQRYRPPWRAEIRPARSCGSSLVRPVPSCALCAFCGHSCFLAPRIRSRLLNPDSRLLVSSCALCAFSWLSCLLAAGRAGTWTAQQTWAAGGTSPPAGTSSFGRLAGTVELLSGTALICPPIDTSTAFSNSSVAGPPPRALW